MRCLLEGHRFRVFAGTGHFVGQLFSVCVECGKTLRGDEEVPEERREKK